MWAEGFDVHERAHCVQVRGNLATVQCREHCEKVEPIPCTTCRLRSTTRCWMKTSTCPDGPSDGLLKDITNEQRLVADHRWPTNGCYPSFETRSRNRTQHCWESSPLTWFVFLAQQPPDVTAVTHKSVSSRLHASAFHKHCQHVAQLCIDLAARVPTRPTCEC